MRTNVDTPECGSEEKDLFYNRQRFSISGAEDIALRINQGRIGFDLQKDVLANVKGNGMSSFPEHHCEPFQGTITEKRRCACLCNWQKCRFDCILRERKEQMAIVPADGTDIVFEYYEASVIGKKGNIDLVVKYRGQHYIVEAKPPKSSGDPLLKMALEIISYDFALKNDKVKSQAFIERVLKEDSRQYEIKNVKKAILFFKDSYEAEGELTSQYREFTASINYRYESHQTKKLMKSQDISVFILSKDVNGRGWHLQFIPSQDIAV
jgi:hypothetical protein